jgi:KTSC domain
MRRQRVDSSAVVSVGYDDWSKTLEIEFSGGAIYDYAQVPEVLYRDFLAAESKGRFVNLYIKPYFEHEEMTGEPVIYTTRDDGHKRRSDGRAEAARPHAPRRARRRAR